MTRVPPQRPPTARPASQQRPAAPSSQAQKAKKAKVPSQPERPQKSKGPGGAEEGGESTQAPENQGGPEAGKERDPREAGQHETIWGQQTETHAEAEEKKDSRDTAHAEKERKDEAKGPRLPAGGKPGEAARSKGPGVGSAKGQSDGFERARDGGKSPTGHGSESHGAQAPAGGPAAASAQALGGSQALAGAQALAARAPIAALAATRPALAAPSTRPPDAFQLLHQAQDKGVYFKEDDGQSAEREDPELAAAVEEAIRLLFGVRGILRVGPGKNMDHEPVVVVVATQGFGEAALKTVPPQIHRFPTLLAIPFDLLPLKKER